MTDDDLRLGEELTRLASADNFRDVAGPGYTTSDGTPLRSGVFFRSNELQLLDEDAATLAGLGIVDVYDLREDYEVEAHPDVDVPGSTWHGVPVGGIPPGTGAALADADAAVAAMNGVYRGFVTDEASRASFSAVLHGLAASTGGQLFHCTAGKDRTGWVSALLLHLAGVTWEEIERDYLVTNQRSAGTREKYLGLVAEHLGPEKVPTFEPTMVADVDYLRTAKAQAEETYGSLEGYLRDGLGLDADDLTALRTRLLAF